MNVLVAGGTGCVGLALCRRLAEAGHDVAAAARSPTDVALPAGVDPVTLDVTTDNLTAALAGRDALVNLVALPSHRNPRGTTHEAVHYGGTRALVDAAVAADCERVVQVSALGVERGIRTAYFDAKRRADAYVADAPVESVLVRPSVVVGRRCQFLPFLRRTCPPLVCPLPGGATTRIQPIWSGDLARVLAVCTTDPPDALFATETPDARFATETPDARFATETPDARFDRGDATGDATGTATAPTTGDASGTTDATGTTESGPTATVDVGGPEAYSLAAVVRMATDVQWVLSLPRWAAWPGARVAQALPGVPVGLDQYRVLGMENTTDNEDLDLLGIDPAAMRTLPSVIDECPDDPSL